MLKSEHHNFGLLTQTTELSRIAPMEKRCSVLFGDATTAVLLGPVPENRGLLSFAHSTDGTMQDTIYATVPGGNWYDDGPTRLDVGDAAVTQKMFSTTADGSRDVIQRALSSAGLTPKDVDFYACHQGTSWLRSVTQEYAGMVNAKSLDTFAWAANLSAANLPLVLYCAEREGMLKPGDIVVTYSGGSGITHTAAVMVWGT